MIYLKESEINIQRQNENRNKRFNFGKANLIVAIPDQWIDVQTLLQI